MMPMENIAKVLPRLVAENEVKKFYKVSNLPGKPRLSNNASVWKPPEADLSRAIREAIAKAHATGLSTAHGDDKGLYLRYPDGKKEYFQLNWTLSDILEKRQEVLAVVKKYGVTYVQVTVKEFEIGEECEVHFRLLPEPAVLDDLIEELRKILLAKICIITTPVAKDKKWADL